MNRLCNACTTLRMVSSVQRHIRTHEQLEETTHDEAHQAYYSSLYGSLRGCVPSLVRRCVVSGRHTTVRLVRTTRYVERKSMGYIAILLLAANLLLTPHLAPSVSAR